MSRSCGQKLEERNCSCRPSTKSCQVTLLSPPQIAGSATSKWLRVGDTKKTLFGKARVFLPPHSSFVADIGQVFLDGKDVPSLDKHQVMGVDEIS